MAEINLEGIDKRAAKILTGDALNFIDYYAAAKGAKPESLALSAKQWDALETALKKQKRNLAGCTFCGVKLRRASP